jgi:NAD(P)-dependent dehydrogenase (short-subunit alcohol dehydrogenase family)
MYSDPLEEYRGKTAVITGGTNGNLGPIMSQALRDIGMQVYSLDLPEYDVRNSEDIRRFLFSYPEIPCLLINNAAIDNPPTGNGGFWERWDEIIDVNLKGVKLCTQIIGRCMTMENGGGLVINVGSIMADCAANWHNYPDGFDKPVAYGMSKAGCEPLVRNITARYAHMKLRACTIAFGPVDTGKFVEPFRSKIMQSLPLGRFVSKQSVIETLFYVMRCPEFAGQKVLCDAGYGCR